MKKQNLTDQEVQVAVKLFMEYKYPENFKRPNCEDELNSQLKRAHRALNQSRVILDGRHAVE